MKLVVSEHPLFQDFSSQEIEEIIGEFENQKKIILEELISGNFSGDSPLRRMFHKSIGGMSYFLSKETTIELRGILKSMDDNSFSHDNAEKLKGFYSELEFSI